MRRIFYAVPLACVAIAASAQDQSPLAQGRSILGSTPGYLKRGEAPDDRILVPPPPAAGSSAEARDAEANKAALAMKDSPRWALAAKDADLASPWAPFNCALGVSLTAENAPRVTTLARRVMRDLAGSTSATKAQYKRLRPFLSNGAPLCTPGEEGVLKQNFSYPSGHSAIGWGLALVLAELAPDRTDALLSRGIAFGQSRVICNVHWLSDVEQGRVAASAMVARLHAVPEFRADVEAARAELAALRQSGQAVQGAQCESESLALAAR